MGVPPFQPIVPVDHPNSFTGISAPSRIDWVTINTKPMTRTVTNFVPSDFAELYAHYYAYVAKLVIRFGIPMAEAEDVTQSILLTFYEKDALSDFDPERFNEYQGRLRKAVFGTFLSGFVRAYVRHYRTRIEVHAGREGLSVDMPIKSLDGDARTLYDLLADPVEENYDDLMDAELLAQVRAHLSAWKPQRPQSLLNMPLFFEVILDQLAEKDRVDASELAELFGVSTTSVQNWLKQLRSEIQKVIEARQ